MQVLYIDSQEKFQQILGDFKSAKHLAVDTEFFRETSYYPHLGLVQIADSKRIACIDPRAFDAKTLLAEILLDNTITKVFHACMQDLEVFYHYLGHLPCPLVDTQIAAALLGEQNQMGYARLVKAQLGIELEDSQTRTNWLQRPLTRKQIEYAADDVRYLITLYEQLHKQLENLGREKWLKQDCEKLCHVEKRFQPNTKNSWPRVRGVNKLNGIELAIVDSITQWREQLAIDKDMTRRKIIADDIVIQLAKLKPDSASSVAPIGELNKKLTQNELESLAEAVRVGGKTPEAEWPSHGNHRLTSEQKAQRSELVDLLDNKATELGISAGVLCTRKDIESIIMGNRELPVLDGWRLELIGHELLQKTPIPSQPTD